MMGRDDQGMQLSQVQFAIRVDEHERTAAALWRAITRGSGLSQDAFGEETDGPAATAKEIGARGSRTRDTRARKIMYAKPAIAHIVSVLCELDAVHFGGDGMSRGSMPINVEWPAELPDLESVARTVQLFDAASAVSLRTKIGMAHPRWGTSEIDAEIAEIDGDRSRSAPPSLPDPFARLD